MNAGNGTAEHGIPGRSSSGTVLAVGSELPEWVDVHPVGKWR